MFNMNTYYTSKDSKLKLYVNNILKLLRKYGWMLDCYVLDFFSDNLWDRLPGKWAEVMVDLQSNEIAYFLLEMYTSKSRQNSQEPKFRKVWPLELLAFIALCHALSLNCQTWVDKTQTTHQTTHQNTVNKDTSCKHAKATGGKARISASAKIIQEDFKQPEVKASHTGETRKEHCSNLIHPFQRHIKPKKRYEIEVLSKVICEQAEKLRCCNIVDVGAGLGHLSRLLSYGYKLRVVTIESDGCHQSGAEKIDQRVLAHLKKERGAVDRSLVHITHHISADISAAEFSSVVLQAFSKMEKQKQDVTGLQGRQQEYFDNFLIVGLHTCGDLAPTLLRVFSQCPNAIGIISIGCCYMKLSHKKAKTDQGTTAQNIEIKLDTVSNSPCSSKVCSSLQKTSIKTTSLKKQNIPRFVDSSCKYNGTDICSKFGRFESERLEGGRQALKTSCDGFGDVENYAEDDRGVLGYPISYHVQRLRGHLQTYNALESACHAIDRYHKKLVEVSPTLKLHYYRALLELLLKQKDPGCSRRQIRTLKTKRAANMTFAEYVTSACDILNVVEFRPTLQDIQNAEQVHAGKQFHVVVFYVLRLLLAPVIEGLLLVDRLIYVRESHPDIRNARISMVFDPDVSPRNFAIIAEKLT